MEKEAAWLVCFVTGYRGCMDGDGLIGGTKTCVPGAIYYYYEQKKV